MDVEFESVGAVVGFAVRENITLAKPSGTTEGDLLIAWIITYTESTEAEDVSAATGWAPVPGASWPAEWQNGVANMEGRAFYKFATGSEPSSYTFDHGSNYSEGWIVRFSSADQSTPFVPTPTINSGNAADSTYTGLTTARDGSLILLVHHDNGDSSTALSPPTGSTPTFTTRVSTSNGASVTWGATGVLATAGATGNKTMANNANTGNYWTAVMIAVQPALPPDNEAPANTSAPTVTGTPQVGQTLTGTDGTWTGTPTPTLARKWQISADGESGWADISGATSSTYAPVSGDVAKFTRFAVTGTNTEGSATAYSDPVGPIAAPPPLDVTQQLSGGESNTDPTLSLGGAASSTQVTLDPGQTGLFGNAETGTEIVDYRCVYVANNEAEAGVTATAYIAQQFAEQDLELAVGAATEAAGETVAAIPNATTAPDGVSFSAPTSAETGVDLGEIGPGETKGLWLRRTIPAAATEDATNPAQYGVYIEPVV